MRWRAIRGRGSSPGSRWRAAVLLACPTPAYSHKPITTNILFKNEIAQIFQRKCFQCHSENNLCDVADDLHRGAAVGARDS